MANDKQLLQLVLLSGTTGYDALFSYDRKKRKSTRATLEEPSYLHSSREIATPLRILKQHTQIQRREERRGGGGGGGHQLTPFIIISLLLFSYFFSSSTYHTRI